MEFKKSEYYKLLLAQTGMNFINIDKQTRSYKGLDAAPILESLLMKVATENYISGKWYKHTFETIKQNIEQEARKAAMLHWEKVTDKKGEFENLTHALNPL